MDFDRQSTAHTPAWRDPLSAGWRAHRGLLLLRLRWHERRDARMEVGRHPGDGPSHAAPIVGD